MSNGQEGDVTHEEIEEQVLLLRDGELPAAQMALVAEHLTACPACQDLATVIDGIGFAVSRDPKPEPSPRFISSVMDRIAQEDGPADDGIELPLRWWAPAFAAGLAGMFFLLTSPEARQPVSLETILTASAGISPEDDAGSDSSDLADMLGLSLEDL